MERRLDGRVEAVEQVTITAQTAGRVTQLPFDVNEPVAAGALLVRLRGTEQRAGLVQAQAQPPAAGQDLPAGGRVVLPDPGGEYQSVQPAQRGGQGADLAHDPVDEQIDRLPRMRVGRRPQGAHVG